MRLEIGISQEHDEEGRGCHISLSGDHRPSRYVTPRRETYIYSKKWDCSESGILTNFTQFIRSTLKPLHSRFKIDFSKGT